MRSFIALLNFILIISEYIPAVILFMRPVLIAWMVGR